MEYSVACNQRFTAYQNATSSPKSVNVIVREHCGGNSRVFIVDANQTVVNQYYFHSPGGAITVTVDPNQQIETFCDGGTDPQGCKVEISF